MHAQHPTCSCSWEGVALVKAGWSCAGILVRLYGTAVLITFPVYRTTYLGYRHTCAFCTIHWTTPCQSSLDAARLVCLCDKPGRSLCPCIYPTKQSICLALQPQDTPDYHGQAPKEYLLAKNHNINICTGHPRSGTCATTALAKPSLHN